MGVQVRCPSERCATRFQADERWLGRNLYCPACGIRMTARPVDVEEELGRKQPSPAGGPGAGLPRLPFCVLVDNIRSLWNVGSIFRTADACGVVRILLCGITGSPPRPEISKTALGAEEVVGWEYHPDSLRAFRALRAEGYHGVALEATDRSIPLGRVSWPSPLCLVVGNEVAGISPALLDACALHVSIPMLGVKESLNVAVAFGIAGHAAATALGSRSGEYNR